MTVDYRRDLAPPLLALVFSLGLHGALFELRPPWWSQPPPEPVDAVVVEFMDEAASPGPGPAALAPVPPDHTEAAPPPRESPPPQAEAVPPQPEPVAPAPEPEPEIVEAPGPGPAPAEAEPLPSEPAPLPPSPDTAPPPEPAPSHPTVVDLMPTAADLQRFAQPAELPDPTAAGVREATLRLGNKDLRYQGYEDAVHAAIDRSVKWREAVLAGGGGEVVVRMSITTLGQLISAEITRRSGNYLLDSAALEAVERARIPPFPAHWKIERLHLYAKFNYQLVTR